MPRTAICREQAARVLEKAQLVRVAFRDGDSTYLIPLGYTWLGSALYGVADRGLKTELAERDPSVAFQVDTAIDTGLFEWESVAGTGRFVVVLRLSLMEMKQAAQSRHCSRSLRGLPSGGVGNRDREWRKVR
jgi:nitroimidazol reductase NimA-like FMN-containing flavoprotein (pyridoxamine 5'-phosphate oxidase superfamily)